MAHRSIFAHIGFGHLVNADYVYAVMNARTNYCKRFLRSLKRKPGQNIVNLTNGKEVKAVLLLETGDIILSHITAETLRYRLSNLRKPFGDVTGDQADEIDETEEEDETDLEEEVEEDIDEID